jgi:hypothetical protein
MVPAPHKAMTSLRSGFLQRYVWVSPVRNTLQSDLWKAEHREPRPNSQALDLITRSIGLVPLLQKHDNLAVDECASIFTI